MALKKFDFGSLVDLDGGRVREALEQAVARCLADCKDRPGLIEPRTVTLIMNMTPMASQDVLSLESVNMEFHIVEKAPKRKSKAYEMQARGEGLFFNELSPDDADQGTIDELVEPGPKLHKEVKKNAR